MQLRRPRRRRADGDRSPTYSPWSWARLPSAAERVPEPCASTSSGPGARRSWWRPSPTTSCRRQAAQPGEVRRGSRSSLRRSSTSNRPAEAARRARSRPPWVPPAAATCTGGTVQSTDDGSVEHQSRRRCRSAPVARRPLVLASREGRRRGRARRGAGGEVAPRRPSARWSPPVATRPRADPLPSSGRSASGPVARSSRTRRPPISKVETWWCTSPALGQRPGAGSGPRRFHAHAADAAARRRTAAPVAVDSRAATASTGALVATLSHSHGVMTSQRSSSWRGGRARCARHAARPRWYSQRVPASPSRSAASVATERLVPQG